VSERESLASRVIRWLRKLLQRRKADQLQYPPGE
jgi:hypothetical protein